MTRMLKTRLFGMFVLPNIVFAMLAMPTDARDLIPVLNAALVAGAGGVCVTYLPDVWRVLFVKRPLDSSDWLVVGIFCSWLGILVGRLWSIAWRLLGQPLWLANSDIVSYSVFLGVVAAAFHMAAPGAMDDGRVPTKRWALVGIVITAALFIGILMVYAIDNSVANVLTGRTIG